ncbi:MAG: methyltransferase (plasmid) [Candidatus Algichlamydia australiensis]|nr:methyltransferase [Chlamydiales bacterium]
MAIPYFKLDPHGIVDDILKCENIRKVKILELEFQVFPGVYPSERFRTTDFLLTSLPPLKGKAVCDMGCGIGVVGIHSLLNKALSATFVDINRIAVKNAEANLQTHGLDGEVLRSNCFDSVPKQLFDVIVFNIPFHDDMVEIEVPLAYAFYDPSFKSVRKFLAQAKYYSHKETEIIIAFSNKGNYELLEHLFDSYLYNWKLWKIINNESEFDNRLYLLKNNLGTI